MSISDNLSILIVDDKPKNLLSLKTALDRPGLAIKTATTGNDALSMLPGHDFSLVILDVHMPEMDGFEVAEIMRSRDKTRHIPIIFVADISKERKYKFRDYDSGIVDYLVKPIAPEIIKHKVNVFLTLKQTQNDLKRSAADLEIEIQKRKLIEEEIVCKQKLEGIVDTAIAVCHELTQPLQIIAGYSDLILMDSDDPRNLHQRIHKIKEQVGRVTALTQQLMGLTRYKTKAYLGKTKVVDFSTVNERRKHKRYIPRSGTIVIPKFDKLKQGQVIDISRDGLAFWNSSTFDYPKKATEVTLSIPDKGICLDGLPCKFINNSTKPNVMVLDQNKMKRHRLRFEHLTKDKATQLEDFILKHTSAKSD